jgi:ornithine cyclodeaminase/alanine dehydrogenase-like protein (mu-crystallin family)
MTLVLTAEEVRASIDMPQLIDALEEGLRCEAAGAVDSVPRANLAAASGFFRLMPVVIGPLDIMGFKAFNGSADDGVRYLTALYRASTGELLCLMDASYLTAARTGATTGVAVRLLTDNGRRGDEVGVIGSGLEARTNLEAVCCVVRVRRVNVFSPNREHCRRFAEEMSDRLSVPVEMVGEPAEAADAPIVVVATNTGIGTGVVALRGEWLRDSALVTTIGSTMPALREVDTTAFARAGLVVLDTPQAQEESGDVRAAVSEGAWGQDRVRQLCEFALPGNGHPRADLTIFKSVGTAVQDIVAAASVYDTARRSGAGRELNFLTPKLF